MCRSLTSTTVVIDLTQEESGAERSYSASVPKECQVHTRPCCHCGAIPPNVAYNLHHNMNPAVRFLQRVSRREITTATKDTIRQQLDRGAIRKRLDGFKQRSTAMRSRISAAYDTQKQPRHLSPEEDAALQLLALRFGTRGLAKDRDDVQVSNK
jgi:hypothetical protein